MNEKLLILYGRANCCLCRSLQERLENIPLCDLQPPLKLKVIDIDSRYVSDEIRIRYDLEVPVMAIELGGSLGNLNLPRVSPRLKEEGLFIWIQKQLLI